MTVQPVIAILLARPSKAFAAKVLFRNKWRKKTEEERVLDGLRL